MRDFDLALTAAIELAQRFRVVTDEDLREHLPGVPRPVRSRVFDRLMNERVLHPRRGRSGFDSSAYIGLM